MDKKPSLKTMIRATKAELQRAKREQRQLEYLKTLRLFVKTVQEQNQDLRYDLNLK